MYGSLHVAGREYEVGEAVDIEEDEVMDGRKGC